MLFQAKIVESCSSLDAASVCAPAQLANRGLQMSESAGEWPGV
jgi:hypothetical protein